MKLVDVPEFQFSTLENGGEIAVRGDSVTKGTKIFNLKYFPQQIHINFSPPPSKKKIVLFWFN
jgi:ABC-type Mn2+/Zn2+ transport system ATPase subunit